MGFLRLRSGPASAAERRFRSVLVGFFRRRGPNEREGANLVVLFDPQPFLQERVSEAFVQAVKLGLGHLHVSPWNEKEAASGRPEEPEAAAKTAPT